MYALAGATDVTLTTTFCNCLGIPLSHHILVRPLVRPKLGLANVRLTFFRMSISDCPELKL